MAQRRGILVTIGGVRRRYAIRFRISDLVGNFDVKCAND